MLNIYSAYISQFEMCRRMFVWWKKKKKHGKSFQLFKIKMQRVKFFFLERHEISINTFNERKKLIFILNYKQT